MAVTALEKQCSKCDETKPLEEFHRSSNTKDGRHPTCAACKNSRAAGYYKRWTPEQRAMHRTRVLRSRYGIDADLLAALYEKQEGCCAVCGKSGDRPAINEKRKSKKGTLHVDHDHRSGAVRGLLCFNCNGGLGQFGDSAERLVQAAAYLMREGDDLSR